MTFEDIFGSTTTPIGWLQETNRTVAVLLYGLVMLRLVGRRISGRWSALDLIVAILVGSHLSRAATGNAPLIGTLVATTALFAVHRLLAMAAARWPGVSRVVEGRPVELVRDGQFRRANLAGRAVSIADIEEALRAAGLEDLSQAKLVTLEASGAITVIRKA